MGVQRLFSSKFSSYVHFHGVHWKVKIPLKNFVCKSNVKLFPWLFHQSWVSECSSYLNEFLLNSAVQHKCNPSQFFFILQNRKRFYQAQKKFFSIIAKENLYVSRLLVSCEPSIVRHHFVIIFLVTPTLWKSTMKLSIHICFAPGNIFSRLFFGATITSKVVVLWHCHTPLKLFCWEFVGQIYCFSSLFSSTLMVSAILKTGQWHGTALKVGCS